MIKILLAVGVRLYREGLHSLLSTQGDIEVVGIAEDAVSAAAKADYLHPDIVLVDTKLSGSLSAVRPVLELVPGAKVIALGVAETEPEIIGYAAAGVAGYLTRNGSFEDLVAAIHSVASGELLCSPRIAAVLLRQVTKMTADAAAHLERLTRREMEVIQLIDQGWSNKEIATSLNIEVSTVKNHVHHLLDKLGVTRRGEAAASVRRVVFGEHTHDRALREI